MGKHGSKQVQGGGVQWQCGQVQVSCGIFAWHPRTVPCIYNIIPLKYNTFYHILAVCEHAEQLYSNEKSRIIHISISSYSVQSATASDRLLQSSTDIVGSCTVLYKMNPFYSLCGSMVSVQIDQVLLMLTAHL